MSVPAPVLASVLALSITHEGKSYPLFEVTSSRDRQGNDYRYLQLNSSFKHKDENSKAPRITTLCSIQVMIGLGKAAELLKDHVAADAGQFYFPAKDGSSVSHLRINLNPVRNNSQGNNDVVMARLEAMETAARIQNQKNDLRAALQQSLEEFKAGLIDKDGYLAAKTLCDAQIKALDTVTPVTPPTTTNTAQPTTGEPECPFE